LLIIFKKLLKRKIIIWYSIIYLLTNFIHQLIIFLAFICSLGIFHMINHIVWFVQISINGIFLGLIISNVKILSHPFVSWKFVSFLIIDCKFSVLIIIFESYQKNKIHLGIFSKKLLIFKRDFISAKWFE
jgi:hypothetical protein